MASAGRPGAGQSSLAPPSTARVALQRLVIGNAAGDRAHDVEHVERRHARPRPADVEPRIRQPQPLGRRADGQPQQQALGLGAVLLERAGRRPSGSRISSSSSIGSSRGFCGNMRSASAGHEHDAEGAAARLLRTADEHARRSGSPADARRACAAVPRGRRAPPRARPDRSRPSAAARRARAARAPAVAARAAPDRAKRASHSPQVAVRGQDAERVDDRQREAAQVREVPGVALDARSRGESGSSRCLFAQLLGDTAPRSPASRRCQRSGSPPITAESTISFSHFHGARRVPATTGASSPIVAGATARRSASQSVGSCAARRRRSRSTASSAGSDGTGARGRQRRRAPAPSDRYSANRRADSRSTAQPRMREERAAGRMRPAGAAVEPGRECRRESKASLEQADVVARRSHEHRHLVEAHAGAGLLEDAAGDLDALAAFAGRREEPHVAGGSRSGGWRRREQVAAQRGQVGAAARLEDLRLEAERLRSWSSVARSPNGTVIRTSGAAAISRRANANSTADSIGTSSSSSGSSR